MEYKSLSEKELRKGKYKVKIGGTKEPMPWDEVYSQIRVGFPYEDIAHEFGNIRKIVMFAIEDNIEYIDKVGELFDDEVSVAERKTNLATVDVTLVKTIEDGVGRYVPNFIQSVSVLLGDTIVKGNKIINSEYATSADLKNIMQATQLATDIAGATPRHAAGMQIGNAQINVGGGEFVVEIDHPPEEDVIDVE